MTKKINVNLWASFCLFHGTLSKTRIFGDIYKSYKILIMLNSPVIITESLL